MPLNKSGLKRHRYDLEECQITDLLICCNALQYLLREVYKAAMLKNAKAIIAIHNHPSGDATPSRDDIFLTQRLKKAVNIMLSKIE